MWRRRGSKRRADRGSHRGRGEARIASHPPPPRPPAECGLRATVGGNGRDSTGTTAPFARPHGSRYPGTALVQELRGGPPMCTTQSASGSRGGENSISPPAVMRPPSIDTPVAGSYHSTSSARSPTSMFRRTLPPSGR